jgi:gamma-glutamyltranspeptidase/glutathione hydrolase/leukotriene-C4 hydrolase
MLDPNVAKEMFSRITDDITHNQDYYVWPFDVMPNWARDHGTSHVSVLAENGDAVAITSTINL